VALFDFSQKKHLKTPSHNERFGASGGADSYDTEQVTTSFALVQALPIPPPAAKPQGVARKQRSLQRDNDNVT